MGNKEKAAEDYRKALMEYQVQKDLIKQSDIIYKLGSYLTEEGKARESLRVLGRALDIKVQLDAGEALAKYFFARGLILAGAGLKGEARESFRQGSDHAAGSASERIGRLCRFYQSRLDGEAHGPAEPAAVPSVLHRYHAQGGDGARIERYCEKPQPESFVVDRKFLFYLLRRMARMYRQLQDQENFLQLYTQTWCVERKLKGRSFSKDDNQ
jgi:tetratricopeptide (TPR) repeat protein